MKKLIGVIDCAPTWEASLPLMFTLLDSGTPEGRILARQEFYRMARLADKQVAAMKEAALDRSAAGLVSPPIGTGL